MPDLHEERRQEPRFRAEGHAVLHLGRTPVQAPLLDLSLNGLKLVRPAGLEPQDGQRLKLSLHLGARAPFVAEVKVVHVERDVVGLEFYDMPPADFAILVGVIEAFQRNRQRV